MSKEKQLFCPQRQKVSVYLLAGVAVINLARRRCYFYWTFGKILKEDSVMVFGNNSRVTARRWISLQVGSLSLLPVESGYTHALNQTFVKDDWAEIVNDLTVSSKERSCFVCLCIISASLVLCLGALDNVASFLIFLHASYRRHFCFDSTFGSRYQVYTQLKEFIFIMLMRFVFNTVAVCKNESKVNLAAFPTRSRSQARQIWQLCQQGTSSGQKTTCNLCRGSVISLTFYVLSGFMRWLLLCFPHVFLCSFPMWFPSAPVMHLLHYPSAVSSVFSTRNPQMCFSASMHLQPTRSLV